MKKTVLLVGASLLFLHSCFVYAQQAIKFGVVYFYPPFAFVGNYAKNVSGFDVDMIQALCKTMNASCTFVPMTLQDIFQRLNNNEIDAGVGAISITPERRAKYSFTLPYLKSSSSYLGLSSSKLVISDTGLAGKSIGVLKESSFESYLKRAHPNLKLVKTYLLNTDLIDALLNKKVDLILLDAPVAHYWVNNSSGLFKIFTSAAQSYSLNQEEISIVTRNGNQQLVQQLNHALVLIMQNGIYDAIKGIYFW